MNLQSSIYFEVVDIQYVWFQIIQYDFIVASAIFFIRLKLYMDVLCCRHLQVTDAHGNPKHIVCFVLQIQISAILGGERPQATNNIIHIRKYNGEYILGNPGVLRSCTLTCPLEPHPVKCVLQYAIALRYYQQFSQCYFTNCILV